MAESMDIYEDVFLTILSIVLLSLFLGIGALWIVRFFEMKPCKSEKNPGYSPVLRNSSSFDGQKRSTLPVPQELRLSKLSSSPKRSIPFYEAVEHYIKTSPDEAAKVLKSWFNDA